MKLTISKFSLMRRASVVTALKIYLIDVIPITYDSETVVTQLANCMKVDCKKTRN